MRKVLSSKTSNLIRYKSLPWLQRKISELSRYAYTNIGESINGKFAPKVLMLVPIESIDFYVQGRYEYALNIKMHNIYYQFLAILKQFVDRGFVVDCIEKDKISTEFDTAKYSIILDEGDSLAYLPKLENQKKIFYCTGTKWNSWNEGELRRVNWFYDSYGLRVKPVRQVKPNFSDEAADFILYKGVPEQMSEFSKNAELVQLAMPIEYEPSEIYRDYSVRDFIWIGGWGAVHKGLDIVIDAFEKMPEFNLHLFGSIEKESTVYSWMETKLKANKNIQYHGYADYKSSAFKKIISTCVGHVYPSAGENGCATLAQTAHYGLIPITTKEANNQANFLGFTIEGDTREELVESVVENVKTVISKPDRVIRESSDEIMNFAKQVFTRDAFLTSFNLFLTENKLIN
ncbi:glycosyltransferase [Rufibacter psychrotolerans]|uniref:glycosyltransferase n=1 Tax=Rufibacter psychrotolerans TaxID=2812556 RepID=UPI00196835A3|nr:glycosyltransferase [Rufibacter sp. SYSU D00308]